MATIGKGLIAGCVLGLCVLTASGQVLPAAASLSGHPATINSTSAYLELQDAIARLGAQLQDTYAEHPNLQFRPAYGAEGEIIGYVVTGAGSAKQANMLSALLMELDALGEIANSVDPEFIPVASSDRISKRDAKAAVNH